MPLKLPEKVLLLLSAPTLSLALPRARAPAPAIAFTVWSNPLRSSVAPLATLWTDRALKTLAAPARSVPADTVVTPL